MCYEFLFQMALILYISISTEGAQNKYDGNYYTFILRTRGYKGIMLFILFVCPSSHIVDDICPSSHIPYCWHESLCILLSWHCNWSTNNLCDSSGYWSSSISPYASDSRADLWIVIENISDRLTKVDKVQFMTQDVVQKLKKHFMDIRLASGKWVGLQ